MYKKPIYININKYKYIEREIKNKWIGKMHHPSTYQKKGKIAKLISKWRMLQGIKKDIIW